MALGIVKLSEKSPPSISAGDLMSRHISSLFSDISDLNPKEAMLAPGDFSH